MYRVVVRDGTFQSIAWLYLELENMYSMFWTFVMSQLFSDLSKSAF